MEDKEEEEEMVKLEGYVKMRRTPKFRTGSKMRRMRNG